MGNTRREPRPGTGGHYPRLRAELAKADDRIDVARLRQLLESIGTQAARPRFVEGALYIKGCQRLSALTGQRYGPVQGTY